MRFLVTELTGYAMTGDGRGQGDRRPGTDFQVVDSMFGYRIVRTFWAKNGTRVVDRRRYADVYAAELNRLHG